MAKKAKPAHTPGANPELAEAMRGKAGNLTHADRRTRRTRTRATARRAALGGW